MRNIEVPEILPDVSQEIRDAVSKEIRISQPRSNWASSLGHPCARFGVHRRLDWQTKPPHSSTTQMIFNGGKVIEKYIAKDYLEKAGYTIVEADRPIATDKSGMMEKLQIGGYLDFVCQKDKFEFPVEVKSMAPYDWARIDSIEDLLHSKKTWHKTYPGQLTLYLLGKNYEMGMFLLINKLTYEPKHIWVDLNFTYAEELVQRAELINKHVAAGTYPERIKYEDQICGKCDFAQVCLGDIIRTEAQVLTDDSFLELLELRDATTPSHKSYEEADRELKRRLKDASFEKAIAGDFVIIRQKLHRDEVKIEAMDYWKTSIKRFNKNEEGQAEA